MPNKELYGSTTSGQQYDRAYNRERFSEISRLANNATLPQAVLKINEIIDRIQVISGIAVSSNSSASSESSTSSVSSTSSTSIP
jgi:hypothetical protein